MKNDDNAWTRSPSVRGRSWSLPLQRVGLSPSVTVAPMLVVIVVGRSRSATRSPSWPQRSRCRWRSVLTAPTASSLVSRLPYASGGMA